MIKIIARMIKLLIPFAIILYFYSGTNSVASDMIAAGRNLGLQTKMKIDMFSYSRELVRQRSVGIDFPGDFPFWLNSNFDSVGDVALDPWDNPYILEVDDDRFTLISLGPDGEYNTKDDISYSGTAKLGKGF
jgi:hypothetical protein